MTEMDVYSTIWDETGDTFDYLRGFFTNIQKVQEKASKNGEAIITF